MNYFVKYILLHIRGSRELFCLKPSFYKIVEKAIDKLRVCLVMSNPFDPMGCNLPGPSVPGIFFRQNTGLGCRFPLQGIFPTQRPNRHFLQVLYWQADSLPLSHLRNPLLPNTHRRIYTQQWLFYAIFCVLYCHMSLF